MECDDQSEASVCVAPHSSGAKKRKGKSTRWKIPANALQMLEQVFIIDKFPTVETRRQLAANLKVTPRQVQVWFQNKRQRAAPANPLESATADTAAEVVSSTCARKAERVDATTSQRDVFADEVVATDVGTSSSAMETSSARYLADAWIAAARQARQHRDGDSNATSSEAEPPSLPLAAPASRTVPQAAMSESHSASMGDSMNRSSVTSRDGVALPSHDADQAGPVGRMLTSGGLWPATSWQLIPEASRMQFPGGNANSNHHEARSTSLTMADASRKRSCAVHANVTRSLSSEDWLDSVNRYHPQFATLLPPSYAGLAQLGAQHSTSDVPSTAALIAREAVAKDGVATDGVHCPPALVSSTMCSNACVDSTAAALALTASGNHTATAAALLAEPAIAAAAAVSVAAGPPQDVQALDALLGSVARPFLDAAHAMMAAQCAVPRPRGAPASFGEVQSQHIRTDSAAGTVDIAHNSEDRGRRLSSGRCLSDTSSVVDSITQRELQLDMRERSNNDGKWLADISSKDSTSASDSNACSPPRERVLFTDGRQVSALPVPGWKQLACANPGLLSQMRMAQGQMDLHFQKPHELRQYEQRVHEQHRNQIPAAGRSLSASCVSVSTSSLALCAQFMESHDLARQESILPSAESDVGLAENDRSSGGRLQEPPGSLPLSESVNDLLESLFGSNEMQTTIRTEAAKLEESHKRPRAFSHSSSAASAPQSSNATQQITQTMQCVHPDHCLSTCAARESVHCDISASNANEPANLFLSDDAVQNARASRIRCAADRKVSVCRDGSPVSSTGSCLSASDILQLGDELLHDV